MEHSWVQKKKFNMFVNLTSMGAELQSQNYVDVDYRKPTGPIFLKFWQKFLLQSTIEIQK